MIKKEFRFLFILLIICVFCISFVSAWPFFYTGQVINNQGYYKTDELNAEWQPFTISPTYASYGFGSQPTYKDENWIGGIPQNPYYITHINYNLPTGTDGCDSTFLVVESQYLKVTATNSETICVSASETAADGYIRSNTENTAARLVWSGSKWVAVNVLREWNIDS